MPSGEYFRSNHAWFVWTKYFSTHDVPVLHIAEPLCAEILEAWIMECNCNN